MRAKLKNNRGESIIEALVSLLIAVISIALLVTSVTVATKINLKNKTRQTSELEFHYVDSGTSTTASIDFTSESDNSLDTNVSITLKKNNNYKYYEIR
jgi:Tfp pilus assembly protein PilV